MVELIQLQPPDIRSGVKLPLLVGDRLVFARLGFVGAIELRDHVYFSCAGLAMRYPRCCATSNTVLACISESKPSGGGAASRGTNSPISASVTFRSHPGVG